MPIDYSKIPTEDLNALSNDDLGRVSTETLKMLATIEDTPKVADTPLYQSIMRRLSPYVRPALEYGGAVAGGIAGTPLSPAGSVAGAGLGYAMGRQGANIYDQVAGIKDPQGLLSEAGNAAQDVLVGAGMEMGGQGAGALLQKAGRAIVESGIPRRLYARSLRTPINETWKKALPGEDFTKREMVVKTGYEGQVLPNNAGLSTAIKRTKQIEGNVHQIVGDLTKQGGNDTSIYKLVDEGMGSTYGKAQYSTKDGTANALDSLRNRVIKMGGVKSSLNPNQLQALKQEFWKDINWDRTKNIVDPNGRLTEDAIHGIGNAAMRRLEELAPELHQLNKKQGAYIDLQKAIEHTVARYENLNIGGLQAMILALKNVGLAALEVATGTPTFKAKLAFTLGKIGRGKVGAELTKAGIYAATRGVERSF